MLVYRSGLPCIRGIFVWKLRFWRIFGPHENVRRAKAQMAYLTYLVEKKRYAGTRKKDDRTQLRKTFMLN